MRLSIQQLQVASKINQLIAQTNTGIAAAVQADENPELDQLAGQPGQVEMQSPDSYIKLTSESGQATGFESKILSDVKSPSGEVLFHSGSSLVWSKNAEGEEQFENRFVTGQGQTLVQQLKIGAQAGFLDYDEFTVATQAS